MSTRTITSRRPAVAVLAGLALTAGIAACGSDGGDDTATDPAGSTSSPSDTPSDAPSDTPSGTPTESTSETPTEAPQSGSGSQGQIKAVGTAGVTEAMLVSATDAGGTVSETAFALDTDQAVADFTGELQNGFDGTVAQTVSEVAQQSPDATPYGAVVSIGCEPPRSVAIEAGEAGFQVAPKLPKSTVECLAPVTYVVVFAAPDA